jgi:hypothetical protein
MKPIQHVSTNVILKAPADLPVSKCADMPATIISWENGGRGVISYWRPDAAELALLNAGNCVRVFAIGASQPPLALGVDGDGAPT